MSLRDTLQSIKEQSAQKLPEEAKETMRRATQQLADSGQVERALGAGDRMPSFRLISHEEVAVDSPELLRQAPLVLQFYRGYW